MYWKPYKWKHPTNIKGLMDEASVKWIDLNGLSSYLQDYRIHLFTPYDVDKSKLSNFKTELGKIVGYVKYSNDKSELDKYVKEANLKLSTKGTDLVNQLTNSKIQYDREEIVDVCKAIDDMLADSRAAGIAEGIEKGLEKGRVEGITAGTMEAWVKAAKTMEMRGLKAAEIAANLGISEETLAEAFEFVEKKEDGSARHEGLRV